MQRMHPFWEAMLYRETAKRTSSWKLFSMKFEDRSTVEDWVKHPCSEIKKGVNSSYSFPIILCSRNLTYIKRSRIKTMLCCSSSLIMRLPRFSFKMHLKYLLNRLKEKKSPNQQSTNFGNFLFHILFTEEE